MTKPSAPAHPVHSPHFRQWFWLTGILLFFGFLSLVKSILLPFVVGILAAYFLDPAVRSLRVKGWSRTLAAAVITAGFFIVATILAVILVPLITRQMSMLIIELPGYLQTLQDTYGGDLQDYLNRLSLDQVGTIRNAAGSAGATIMGFAGHIASGAVQSGLALLNILLLVFLTPVVAFYLLRDWDLVVVHFDQMLPRDQADTIREQLAAIDRALSGFIRGQTNVCLIMASYYGIALTFLGLKFGLGLGIMTGLLLFVPFVGFATGFTLSMAIGLFQFGLSMPLLGVLGIYLVGMLLESSVITPKLVGSRVGLHPLWIIFGMLCGATLFGFVGILLAVPVTTVIGVLARFAMERYLHSSLYASGG